MKLTDFLRNNGIDQQTFAEAIGVSQVTVSRYCTGARTPRPTILQRIRKATHGAVQANDFFDAEQLAVPKCTPWGAFDGGEGEGSAHHEH